jgi:hypothetical protein
MIIYDRTEPNHFPGDRAIEIVQYTGVRLPAIGRGNWKPILTGFRRCAKQAAGRKSAFFAGADRSYSGVAWNAGRPEAPGYYVLAMPKK